jgi:hypothetical protein
MAQNRSYVIFRNLIVLTMDSRLLNLVDLHTYRIRNTNNSTGGENESN